MSRLDARGFLYPMIAALEGFGHFSAFYTERVNIYKRHPLPSRLQSRSKRQQFEKTKQISVLSTEAIRQHKPSRKKGSVRALTSNLNVYTFGHLLDEYQTSQRRICKTWRYTPQRKQAAINLHHSHFHTNKSYRRQREPWIRNDEGLSLETSASQPLAVRNLPYQLG